MKKPLTISPFETRAKIKADGRTPASWARMRGFTNGMVSRVFADCYPHTDAEGEYQRMLRALHDDGYLVEAGPKTGAAA